MNGSTDDVTSGPGGTPGGSRTTPIAAIAGAIVLVGLVGFALYRRASGPATPPVAEAPTAEATSSTGEGAAPDATAGDAAASADID
ncbi:MAG TPA: hypothetical protein VJV75_09410, partial [Candidatus Polarisedimenticolia bacterium]|nr:hypothetical protein [Candidatus Polarisedimenticolia bacterium]